jgi:uncharacterized protein DUF1579
MRKALVVSWLLVAGMAMAEDKPAGGGMPPMPKPGENHKKLDWLVGTWDVAEHFHKTDMNPEGEGKGVDTITWTLGGMWQSGDYHSEGVMGKYEGHGLLGWDETKKEYIGYWFDMYGGHTELRGNWDGDKLVLTSGEYEYQGQKYKDRHTYTKVSDKEFKFMVESDMGKGFVVFMDSDFKKR